MNLKAFLPFVSQGKVAILCCKLAGGSGAVSVNLAEEFLREGYDVTLIMQPDWFLPKPKFSYLELKAEEQSKVLAARRFSCEEKKRFFHDGIWKRKNDENNNNFSSLLNEIGFESYALCSIQATQFARESELLALSGVPVIYSCNSLVKLEEDLEERPRGRASSYQEQLLQNATFVQAFTAAYADQIRSYYPDISPKIIIVPHGTDHITVRRDDSALFKEKRKILSVGRYDPAKGFEYLIASMVHLQDIPNVELHLIGEEGPLKAKYQQLIQAHSLENRIHLMNWVQPEDLWRHYSTADVYVQPSLHESFCFSLMEAALYKLPLIHTDTTSLSELFNTGGSLMVSPKDSVALASALRNVLEGVYPPTMPQEARRIAEQFSWNGTAKMLLEYIK